MSFASLLIHTVEIFNSSATSTDRRGNDVLVDDAGVTEPARVQEQKASEADDAQSDVRVATYLVFLPAGSVAESTSTIAWEGHRHRVVGEPSKIDGRSSPHHVELIMERIEGA